VQVAYLSQGAVESKSPEEARTIRREEARRACRLMGAEPFFLFDELGWPRLDEPWVRRVTDLLRRAAPSMVFAHWPLDSHEEHQVAALVALRAVSALDPQPELYFFEVERGRQTAAFSPSVYVDITAVEEAKLDALSAHESQNPTRIYERDHEPMELFRGREAGVKLAEAFVPLKAGASELASSLR
jgi:LmbE family N-acetylglucosaminyl deacetylase